MRRCHYVRYCPTAYVLDSCSLVVFVHLGPLITLTPLWKSTGPPGGTSREPLTILINDVVAKCHQGEIYVQLDISHTLLTVGIIPKLGYDLLQLTEKCLPDGIHR